jgi:glyoxylase-like metal-dependent hydrolase (beta-lactamase superfamily II)
VTPAWATLVRADNPGPMTLDGTNTWVLRGPESPSCVVVDPGPLDSRHLAAVAAHAPVAAVLLTHSHPDHAEGVGQFAELTGAPLLPGLTGEPVELGGVTIRALATPGHTGDSVSYVVNGEAVLTGDTILGHGSTVLEGSLADYLASLSLLRDLGDLTVLPGHGPVLPSVAEVASAYLAHRHERLAQVRAALDAGATGLAQVVAYVYADVDPALWPAAELSVRAQLEYLEAL